MASLLTRSQRMVSYWKAATHKLIKTYPEQFFCYSTFGTATVIMGIYKMKKFMENGDKPYYRGYYDVIRSTDPVAGYWRKPEEYPAPYLSSGVEYA